MENETRNSEAMQQYREEVERLNERWATPSAGAMRAADRAFDSVITWTENVRTRLSAEEEVETIAAIIDAETGLADLKAQEYATSEIARERGELLDEARDALENVTAALENVLLHQGEPMSPEDRAGRLRMIREARAILAKIEGREEAQR